LIAAAAMIVVLNMVSLLTPKKQNIMPMSRKHSFVQQNVSEMKSWAGKLVK
jgi:hypothetical protein